MVPLFIGIKVDPRKPIAPLSHMLDHHKVVAPDSGPLYPEFEALVLELQDIVHLYLVDPVDIACHESTARHALPFLLECNDIIT